MGDKLNSVLETAKSLISFEEIMGQINGLISKIPADILAFYEANKILCLIGAICLLTLVAFEGYKLFKMVVYAGGAFVFGFIGLRYLAPEFPESIRTMVTNLVDFDIAVAIVCALIAVFLCRFAYDFMIMILGGVAGYFLGSMYIYKLLISYFNTLDFLQNDVVKYVIGGIVSAMFSILFILLFKHIFMIFSSFGGMIGGAILLQSLLIPTGDDSIKISFVVLGAAVGVFALVHQYKEEEKANEFVF